jgi:hypothetical protein
VSDSPFCVHVCEVSAVLVTSSLASCVIVAVAVFIVDVPSLNVVVTVIVLLAFVLLTDTVHLNVSLREDVPVNEHDITLPYVFVQPDADKSDSDDALKLTVPHDPEFDLHVNPADALLLVVDVGLLLELV